MSKKRKLHRLIVTITSAYQGLSKSKTYKNQPFYYLNLEEETILGKRKDAVYAFFNLTNKKFWQVLEKQAFKNQKYLFFCEKRNRG